MTSHISQSHGENTTAVQRGSIEQQPVGLTVVDHKVQTVAQSIVTPAAASAFFSQPLSTPDGQPLQQDAQAELPFGCGKFLSHVAAF